MSQKQPSSRLVQFSATALLIASSLAVFAGCQSRNADFYAKERVRRADAAFAHLNTRILENREYSLEDCINEAMENNYDLRLATQAEAVAAEKSTAAMLGMLPSLKASINNNWRNNDSGSSSQQLPSHRWTKTYSGSSERSTTDFSVTAVLSTLDFGMSFMTAQQAKDKRLYAAQQALRVRQNIIFDVVKAYYLAATAQYVVETTRTTLDRCREVEGLLSKLEESRQIDPLTALTERRQLSEMRKRLLESERSHQNYKWELSTLMGRRSLGNFKIKTDKLENFHKIETPEVPKMERLALLMRPELAQSDIQADVLLWEARKKLFSMFPNISVAPSYNQTSNKYTYEKDWIAVATSASLDLLSLPQKWYDYKGSRDEYKNTKEAVLSLSLGVMSQIRITDCNLAEARKRFELDNEIYNSYVKQYGVLKSDIDAGGKTSRFVLYRTDLEVSLSSVDRIRTLGDYYVAYFRLLNSIGADVMEPAQLAAVANEAAESAKKRDENHAEGWKKLADLDQARAKHESRAKLFGRKAAAATTAAGEQEKLSVAAKERADRLGAELAQASSQLKDEKALTPEARTALEQKIALLGEDKNAALLAAANHAKARDTQKEMAERFESMKKDALRDSKKDSDSRSDAEKEADSMEYQVYGILDRH